MDSAVPVRPRARRLATYVGWLVVALTLALLHVGTTREYLSLERLFTFDEPEPFRNRVLIPLLTRLVVSSAPAIPIGMGFFLLEWAAWIGLFVAASRALASLENRDVRRARHLLALTIAWPAIAQLVKPSSFALVRPGGALSRPEHWQFIFERVTASPNLFYPYDVPSMAFTLALMAMMVSLSRRVTAGAVARYLCVFALALTNRETALLLIPVSVVLLTAGGHRRPAVALAGLQVALVILVRGGIHLALGPVAQTNVHANLGLGGYELNLWSNVKSLLRPLDMLATVPLFLGGLWIPLLLLRRHLDPIHAVWIRWHVSLVVLSALCFGQLLEGRVLAEAVGPLWLALVHTCAAARPGGSAATRTEPT